MITCRRCVCNTYTKSPPNQCLPMGGRLAERVVDLAGTTRFLAKAALSTTDASTGVEAPEPWLVCFSFISSKRDKEEDSEETDAESSGFLADSGSVRLAAIPLGVLQPFSGMDEAAAAGAAATSLRRLLGLPSSHWLTWLAKRRDDSDSKYEASVGLKLTIYTTQAHSRHVR